MWLQAHVGFWTLAIIFFIISYILQVTGKQTGQKVTHMILRLLYVLVVITGLYLVFHLYSVHGFMIIVKMILGLLVICMMEMVLIRRKKEKSTGLFWILLIIFFILVFYVAYGVLQA